MTSRKTPRRPRPPPEDSREPRPSDHLRQEVEALDAVLNLPQPAGRRSGNGTARKPPRKPGKHA